MSEPARPGATPHAKPVLRLAGIWWVIGWVLLAMILLGTLAPPVYVPNLHLWDKFEHAFAFFGLTFWFCGLTRVRAFPLVALWMLLLGGGIEIAQGTMGWGRDADVLDWVADAVGVGVALVLVYLCAFLGISSWMSCLERLFGPSRDYP